MGKSIFQLSSKTSVLTNTLASHHFSSKKKILYSMTAIAIAGSFFVASGAALTQPPSENIRYPESNRPAEVPATVSDQASDMAAPDGNSQIPANDQTLTNSSNPGVLNSTANSDEQNSRVEVTVNGENIPIPQNGTVHKSVQTAEGNAEINVTIQNSQNSSGPATKSRSTQSSNISIDSSSTSSVQTNTKEEVRMR